MNRSASIPIGSPLFPSQAEWAQVLREVTLEAFSTMAGSTVSFPKDSEALLAAEVTGIVGIAGHMRALFSMRCSRKAATLLSSQMLGVSLEEAEAQRNDAVGEMCNIIAGSFKAKVGMGENCSLSIPTVLAGKNFQVYSTGQTQSLSFSLRYEGEPIWIVLDIKI